MRAAIQMFLPKEPKYKSKLDGKLKMSIVNKHLARIKKIQAKMTPPEKVLKEIE